MPYQISADISCVNSYVPENRHTLKNMRTTFNPFPDSPNPSTSPSAKGNSAAQQMACLLWKPVHYRVRKRSLLHETKAITNIIVLVSTHGVPKNTNISNKFTLYHTVSFQKTIVNFCQQTA